MRERHFNTQRLFGVLIMVVASAVLMVPGVFGDSLNKWIDRLRDPQNRTAAAYNFGEIDANSPDTIEILTGSLEDSDPYLRRYAAAALGEIGLEPEITVPVLITALSDSDADVRNQAAFALAKIGMEAAPQLIEALSQFDRGVDPEISPQELQTARQYWREQDGLAIREHVYPATVDPYYKLIKVKRVSDYSAFALQEIGPEIIPALTRTFSVDTPDVHRYVIEILKTYGKAVIPELLKLLSNEKHPVRLLAALALRQSGIAHPSLNKNDLLEIITQSLIQPSEQIPTEFIRNLSLWTNAWDIKNSTNYTRFLSAATEAMIETLADPDPLRVKYAYLVLTGIGPRANPQLAVALDHANPATRAVAAYAVIRNRPSHLLRGKALAIIIDDYQRPRQSVFTREFSFLMLLEFAEDNGPASQTIIKILTHPNVQEKEFVPELLKTLVLPKPGRIQIFQAGLDSSDSDVRIAAMRALLRLDYQDEDGRLAKIAADALIDTSLDPGTRQWLQYRFNISPSNRSFDPQRPGISYASESKSLRDQIQKLEISLGQEDNYIEKLIQNLNNRSTNVRAAAAHLLVRKGRTAVPVLIAALSDPELRFEVLYILGAIGREAGAAVPVIKALADDESVDLYARKAATLSLVKIVPEEAVVWIRRMILMRIQDTQNRHLVYMPLDSTLYFQYLTSLLNDPDIRVRREIAGITARSDAALDFNLQALQQAAEDPDEKLKLIVLRSIWKGFYYINRSEEHLQRLQNAVPAITGMLNAPYSEVKLAAIRLLVALKTDLQLIVTPLTGLLQDPDSRVQSAAAQALLDLGFDASSGGPELWTVITDKHIRSTADSAIRNFIYLRSSLRSYETEIIKYETDAVAASEMPPPSLPVFPLPVYPYSVWEVLPKQWLGDNASTLLDVYQRLQNALTTAGFPSYRLFGFPDGFAVAAQLERIREDGTPYEGKNRWTKGKIPLRSFDIISYLSRLFSEKPGHYRLIVFLITLRDYIPSDAETWNEQQARDFYTSGGLILPRTIAEQSYKGFNVHLLVYHFYKRKGGLSRVLPIEATVSGNEHVAKAGILKPDNIGQPR